MIRFGLAPLVAMLALVGCLCSGPEAQARAAITWREVEPGLAYARIERGGTRFHTLRVNLSSHELGIADARTKARSVATVDVLRAETGAIAAVNGTFFDTNQRPLGLIVNASRELNPLRAVSWWAALVVREGASRPVAELLTTEQVESLTPENRSSIAFAVQVGPRTVVAGRPLKLKPQTAARSAMCITHAGEVLLLASEGSDVESNALAAFMADDASEGGLACHSGLMLDGGPSTQMSVKTGDFALELRGGWGVPNAVVVRPRAKAK